MIIFSKLQKVKLAKNGFPPKHTSTEDQKMYPQSFCVSGILSKTLCNKKFLDFQNILNKNQTYSNIVKIGENKFSIDYFCPSVRKKKEILLQVTAL